MTDFMWGYIAGVFAMFLVAVLFDLTRGVHRR